MILLTLLLATGQANINLTFAVSTQVPFISSTFSVINVSNVGSFYSASVASSTGRVEVHIPYNSLRSSSVFYIWYIDKVDSEFSPIYDLTFTGTAIDIKSDAKFFEKEIELDFMPQIGVKDNMKVFYFDEIKKYWLPIKTRIFDSYVKGYTNHLTMFALFLSSGAKTLESVSIYPNPYKAYIGGGITFTNLTSNSEVSIYTLNMELVKTHKLKPNDGGVWLWDVKNNWGEEVASGLYIVLIKDENLVGSKIWKGKLAIIR
ncbi:MAG: hypothetical protein NZ870_03680 [bacterium]|nr:hypothetical protein [bacterium]